MKKLILLLIVISIATPSLARHTCKPYMKKYWRSAGGKNIVLVGWRCKGSGNGMSIRPGQICGITDNGTKTCADGYSNMSITGGATKHRFDRTEYPINRLFIDK